MGPQRGRLSLLFAALAICTQHVLGDEAPQLANGTAASSVTVHIATTACGQQAAEDVIALLKSIAIHANPANKYFVYVFMSNHTEFPFVQVSWN